MEHELEKAREEQLAAVRAFESSKVLHLLCVCRMCKTSARAAIILF